MLIRAQEMARYVEDGILPHKRTMEDMEGDLGEERRLCYVGMTRARKRLWMTHARSRRMFVLLTCAGSSCIAGSVSGFSGPA